MEYETRAFFLGKSFNSIAKFDVLMFFSYFHDYILILKLNMNRSK
jgi:hypothetical protein